MAVSMSAPATTTSATTRVTATVNPDTECSASIDSTTLNYGDIKASDLHQDKPTALQSRPMTLTVSCAPLASKFFFRIIDRSTEQPIEENLGSAFPDQTPNWFINAVSNGRAVGGLFLKYTGASADKKNQILLYSTGGGSTTLDPYNDWDDSRTPFFRPGPAGEYRYAVGDPGTTAIAAARVFAVHMEATLVIGASAVQGLASDIQFKGQFTIEVTQL